MRIIRLKLILSILTAALSIGLVAPAARGESAAPLPDLKTGVLIYGPQIGRSPTTGAPIQWVSYSIVVHSSDLDLRTDRGVNILNKRIKSASHEACAHLDEMHPITAKDSPVCFKPTYDQGMRDAAAVIAQARVR